MKLNIPSQVVEIPDSTLTPPLTNVQGSLLQPNQVCCLTPSGVKWASCADLALCRNIVYPVATIEVGASGVFRVGGIHDFGIADSFVPGHPYYLTPDGNVSLTPPAAPSEIVQLGFSVTDRLFAIQS